MIERDLSFNREDLHFIRFVREPFSGVEMEVEYVRHGETGQGRIFDVDVTTLEMWLKLRGFEYTEALERAVQSAWNFGQAVYVPSSDRAIPL